VYKKHDERHVELFLQLTKLDLVSRAISEEIRWCEENTDGSPSPEFRRGFIGGLRQSLLLLGEVKRIVDAEQRFESAWVSRFTNPEESEAPPQPQAQVQLSKGQVELFLQWVETNWPHFEEDPEYHHIDAWRREIEIGQKYNLQAVVGLAAHRYTWDCYYDHVNTDWGVTFSEDGGFQVSTDGGETVYLYQPRIYGEE
jgi:hypothetical protein